MNWGYCGGEGGVACSNFSQGLGSFILMLILAGLLCFALIFAVRLLWVAFWAPHLDEHDVRRIMKLYLRYGPPHNVYGWADEEDIIGPLYTRLEAEDERRQKIRDKKDTN